MPSPIAPARLCFNDVGLPVSEAYADVYHSAAGAHAQARHVFLAGNGLPQRWQGRESLVILETGFGLGVNFLATWLAWREDPCRCQTLQFISLEKHPFDAADLALAQAAWPEFAPLAEELRQHWPALDAGCHDLAFEGGRVMLALHFGDAQDSLMQLDAAVDAFYLDGFSPAKNPDLWSPALCLALARLAKRSTTLATWSVAGSVRRALTVAGFTVLRRPGFAGKRQMLSGYYGDGEDDDFVAGA